MYMSNVHSNGAGIEFVITFSLKAVCPAGAMVDVVNVTPLLLILFNPTLKALGPFKYVKPWFNFNEAV